MTNPETDRPATVPPSMSRAAKAEALLLRFTAEAHRRKWNYDRGLDGDGVPVRSEAFDALHLLGEEMRVALEELRRAPAAVSVPPPATRADALTAVRALHQPMQRGPFAICAHCSGWDGEWRCLGVVTDYPCPTLRALDGEQPPVGPCVAGEQQNETPEGAEHMLARMRADAATDSLDGLLRIIADWYRSSEGRDVLFEDLIAAGYRLPERASE